MHFYLRHPLESIRRCQEDPSWCAHVIEIADLSRSNTFIFKEKYEMERCTVPVVFESIDWDHVPFGDPEWCFAFNRHTFLLNNALAAAITGDAAYRDNWIRLFEDFYTRSKLSGKTEKLSWRSLECGIRIENYIRSLEILEAAGMEPDQAILDDFSSFLKEHVSYLLRSHNDFHRISNWGVLQDHGLFLASLFTGDTESMETAIERLDEEMRFQTLPDGMHWEQSSMYQAEVLHAAMDTVLVAGNNGIKLPEDLIRNTHLLALGLAHSLRPDGKCYLFGDSDEIDMRDMIASAAVVFSDPELSYYAQGGIDASFWLSHDVDTVLPEPKEPKQRSFYMKDSGNAFLSLSDDTSLRFHAGLIGSGHGHFDQLHFDLYHRGVAILTDTGRYTYVDTPERRALKGAYGHNTIILGGKEPSVMEDSWGVSDFAEPLFSDAVIDGDYRYLRASHFGYAEDGAFITRSILTIRDRFIIIADDIRAAEPTDAELLFHFDEGTSIRKDGSLVRAEKDGSTIWMQLSEGMTTGIEGSGMSKRYNEMLSAPLLTAKARITRRSCLVTLIAIGDAPFSCSHCGVRKVQSGLDVPSSISEGIIIDDGPDRYSIGIVTNEYPAGGFLLGAGNAEAYGRVFIRKNDENTKVIRY